MADDEPLRHIVLDVSGASYMDTTAIEAVKEWREGYARAGVHLALAEPNAQIVSILHRSGFLNTGTKV